MERGASTGRWAVLAVALLLMAAPRAETQSDRGRISGLVKDESGTPVQGVSVTATNTGTNAVLTSASEWALLSVYARLGERQLALDQLEYLDSVISLPPGRLRHDPRLDPLRDQPRFQKLLAQAARGLPSPPPS